MKQERINKAKNQFFEEPSNWQDWWRKKNRHQSTILGTKAEIKWKFIFIALRVWKNSWNDPVGSFRDLPRQPVPPWAMLTSHKAVFTSQLPCAVPDADLHMLSQGMPTTTSPYCPCTRRHQNCPLASKCMLRHTCSENTLHICAYLSMLTRMHTHSPRCARDDARHVHVCTHLEVPYLNALDHTCVCVHAQCARVQRHFTRNAPRSAWHTQHMSRTPSTCLLPTGTHISVSMHRGPQEALWGGWPYLQFPQQLWLTTWLQVFERFPEHAPEALLTGRAGGWAVT